MLSAIIANLNIVLWKQQLVDTKYLSLQLMYEIIIYSECAINKEITRKILQCSFCFARYNNQNQLDLLMMTLLYVHKNGVIL